MKKTLLVTLQDNTNFGNRLQNYALQEALKERGAEVSNLDNYFTVEPTLKKKISGYSKKYIGALLHSRKLINDYNYFYFEQLRRKTLTGFTEKYIDNVIKMEQTDVFSKDWNEYDLAVSGSDQVWHKWRENDLELPYYYLEFMSEDKRASYAASFGFEQFPKEDKSAHITGLKGMHSISCREKNGCELIESTVGKHAERVLDPTLLFDGKWWAEREVRPEKIADQKYVLMYFLGYVDDEHKNFIEKTIAGKNLKVLNLKDYSDPDMARIDPFEFIYLIHHAEYVFTDSFHCTVFSLFFDTDFTVFRRKGAGFEKMFARIEDLLALTNKQNHEYGEENVVIETPSTNMFDTLKTNSYKYLDKIMEKV